MYWMTITVKTERIIGILQPSYLPWLGFFEQLYKSNIFVLYDDVQFEKGAWRNRNRIKTPQGIQWLTVPVLTKNQGLPLIKDVQINAGVPWAQKHIKAITQNYSKAPYFHTYSPDLFDILRQKWTFLLDLNERLIVWFCNQMGLTTRLTRSSELDVSGVNVVRLIKIIKTLGGKRFYEGAAGRNYIDPGLFLEHGLEVVFQDYEHPRYPQLYAPFVSHLSIIDLLFNCGPESLKIIINGNE